MKKVNPLLFIALLTFSAARAQVGIGTPSPHASAMLEIKNTNKGLLIPQVTLTGTNDVATIPAPATSLLVYNTAATTGSTAVNPGFYYWSGTAWVVLSTGTAAGTWLHTGNAGTDATTHFIGTTDNVPLNIRVNNEKAGSIDHLKQNSFWGYRAGNANTSGFRNTANGFSALLVNTNGAENTANGFNALFSNTSGSFNTANGAWALQNNTTGIQNTANGFAALLLNTTGRGNTATGWSALYSNTTGILNTANGINALYSNNEGNQNTANGQNALYSNIAGHQNIANGQNALYANTYGNGNTAVGFSALTSNTTGSTNTAVGDRADVSTGNLTNATAIGNRAIVNASNKVRIGNTSVTAIEGQVAFSHPSDARFKYNIQNDVPGLDFITKLKPVTYFFDEEKLAEFTKTGTLTNSNIHAAAYKGEKRRHTGFLAQDVERLAKELGYSFDGVHAPANSNDHYSLAYSQFIMPLVKAVQEQQQVIEWQEEALKKMQGKIDALQNEAAAQKQAFENRLKKLEALVQQQTATK